MNLGQSSVGRKLSIQGFIALLLGSILSPATVALAVDTPVQGALAGTYFRAECPPGAFLVGFSGRTGAWIDQIAPVCQPLSSDNRTFGNFMVGTTIGTSTGGNVDHSRCPNNTVIRVTRHSMSIGSDARPKYVESISGDCFTTGGAYNGIQTFGHPTQLPIIDTTSKPLDSLSQCPNGQFARGIHGRAGQFLNALGLICGPLVPRKAGTGLPSDVPKTTSAFPTAPTINSPTPNGYLVKGKGVFKITPSQYLTGTHVNYQLRWLNAPAAVKQSGGDFSNQEIPMTLIASSSGLPIPQVLLAPGTWEIRVRINQPKAGDWSDWVRFEYMLQDPIRQTVPQALSPGIGTTLIRPREVEPKGRPDETHTAGPTQGTERTP